MFNLLASIAEFFAPLMAGFTTGYFGYVKAYLMAGSFTVIFGLMYYVICGFGKEVEPEEVKSPILFESAPEFKKSSQSDSATKRKSAYGPSDEE